MRRNPTLLRAELLVLSCALMLTAGSIAFAELEEPVAETIRAGLSGSA